MVQRQLGAIRQHCRGVISTVGMCVSLEDGLPYDAVVEEAFESVVMGALSPVTTGFDSLSSSLGTIGSAASPVTAAEAELCGVASSVDSLAPAVSLAEVDPPLAPPRERVLPLPLGFGGIAVVAVSSGDG